MAITHTPGLPTISLALNQTYLVSYSINVINNSRGNEFHGGYIVIKWKDRFQFMYENRFFFNGQGMTLATTVLVITGVAPHDLTVINSGPGQLL